jgi:hypothetical protein
MPEDAQTREFDLHVLKELEALFEKEALETLVAPPKYSTDGQHSLILDPALLVRHVDGREVECSRFDTQIRNKISCLIELLRKK